MIRQSLVALYNMSGIQWTYSIHRPLVISYYMLGMRWIYSILGSLVVSYNMPGIQWIYSSPGPTDTVKTHPSINRQILRSLTGNYHNQGRFLKTGPHGRCAQTQLSDQCPGRDCFQSFIITITNPFPQLLGLVH